MAVAERRGVLSRLRSRRRGAPSRRFTGLRGRRPPRGPAPDVALSAPPRPHRLVDSARCPSCVPSSDRRCPSSSRRASARCPGIAQVALAVLAAVVVVLAALFFLRRRGERRAAAGRRARADRVQPALRVAARAGRPAGGRRCGSRPPRGPRPAELHRQAVQGPALQGRRDGHPDARVGEHDRPDAADDPGLRVAGRRPRELQPPARLRDPLPGEDRRPHDVRPPDDPPARRRHAAARGRRHLDGRRALRLDSARRRRRRRRQRAEDRDPLLPLRHPAPVSADGQVTFDDFAAVDIRVGRIVEVEDFPEARRPAWKLRVDFGPKIGVRRSSAQIKNYGREDLEGRLVLGRRELPAAPDRPGALGGARARHVQRGGRAAPQSRAASRARRPRRLSGPGGPGSAQPPGATVPPAATTARCRRSDRTGAAAGDGGSAGGRWVAGVVVGGAGAGVVSGGGGGAVVAGGAGTEGVGSSGATTPPDDALPGCSAGSVEVSDSCCGAAGFAAAAPPVRCRVAGGGRPPLAVAGPFSASLALFFFASASFFAALSDGEDAFSVTAGSRWRGVRGAAARRRAGPARRRRPGSQAPRRPPACAAP